MRPNKFIARIILIVVVGCGFFVVQIRAQSDETLKPPKRSETVPEAALLTERGRQLAHELKMLKRTRDTMGPKHPTLPVVEKKIDAVLELLSAFEPAYGDSTDNPFRKGGEKTDPDMINEYDLRQIVLRLSKRVEQLEARVTELEGKKK
ncbi:MAG: hypothetical protein AAF802_30580 [Planctomycetota bacterium]